MLLKPTPKSSQKPQWQFSTNVPHSSKPSHYNNPRHTLLSDGQGQKLFNESFDYRSLEVPKLFKESVFVPKLSKFQVDPVPFMQLERDWERSKRGKTLRMHHSRPSQLVGSRRTSHANGGLSSRGLTNMKRSKSEIALSPDQDIVAGKGLRDPTTSRRATSTIGQLRQAVHHSRRQSQPVIVREKNISTRRSEWRKYRKSREHEAQRQAIQQDYYATKPKKWNNRTSLNTHDIIVMEEQVTLPSGRTRVQRRQKKISELDRIIFDNGHHSKLKKFKQRKYPSLVDRSKQDMQKKRAVLEKTRRREEEIVQFGGTLYEQQKKQQETARPVWKQTLFVNQEELSKRDAKLLNQSLANSRRKLKSASSAYSFRSMSRSSCRGEN